MSNKQNGLLALYGSVLLLALNGLFAKLIPLDASSMSQMRSVVACVSLFAILLWQRKRLQLPSVKAGIGVYLLGLLLGLHWITYFHAMQVSSVAVGMLSLFCYPVITVVLEPFFHKQWPKLVDLAAALLVFVGVGVMASEGLFNAAHDDVLHGALWGVVSAFLFATRNTVQKYCFHDIDSISLMGHQVLAISIMFIPLIDISLVQDMEAKSWGLLIALGIFSTAAAHTLLAVSLKHLHAKSVAMISCTLPLVGSVLAWLVLGEIPGLMIFVGGAIILAVATYESIKQSRQNG
ncbi:hypothetical protein TDB9533_03947 [Thalassocella blandensis]|nr:hypothetical protein TDB9533_03947 [Thalassocella blandensis]